MAGHNKWSKIKNKKGVADVQRGKMFTKLGRAIAVAVREGGDNPEYNAALQAAVDKAKAYNMPNKNIERAIKSATQNLDGANFEHVIYEGYGPQGIAVLVECLTDNRNRTAPEVRHAFDKFGGNLGTSGSVSFMFDRLGVIIIDSKDIDADELMMVALEADAKDIKTEDGITEIYTSVENFNNAKNIIKDAGYEFENAEIMYIPQNLQDITDEDIIKKMNGLIDMLEENDDVQDVYHNWNDDEE